MPASYSYTAPVDGTFVGGPKSHHGAPRPGVNAAGEDREHSGADWQAQNGSIARAIIGGTVVYTGTHTGYGTMADVLGADGHVQRYATHGTVTVSPGQKVVAGQPIGIIGGGHLHFEIIPPGTPAFNTAIAGKDLGRTSWYSGLSPTIDPAGYFGMKRGTPVIGGKPFGSGVGAGVGASFPGGGNIQSGARGQQVEAIQNALLSAGYSVGARGVDGDFGKDTKAAVVSFQRANGLDPDGIVGPRTMTALATRTGVMSQEYAGPNRVTPQAAPPRTSYTPFTPAPRTAASSVPFGLAGEMTASPAQNAASRINGAFSAAASAPNAARQAAAVAPFASRSPASTDYKGVGSLAMSPEARPSTRFGANMPADIAARSVVAQSFPGMKQVAYTPAPARATPVRPVGVGFLGSPELAANKAAIAPAVTATAKPKGALPGGLLGPAFVYGAKQLAGMVPNFGLAPAAPQQSYGAKLGTAVKNLGSAALDVGKAAVGPAISLYAGSGKVQNALTAGGNNPAAAWAALGPNPTQTQIAQLSRALGVQGRGTSGIMSKAATAVAPTIASPSPQPRGVMAGGQFNPRVASLQTAINSAGARIAVDGLMGPQTRAASAATGLSLSSNGSIVQTRPSIVAGSHNANVVNSGSSSSRSQPSGRTTPSSTSYSSTDNAGRSYGSSGYGTGAGRGSPGSYSYGT